MKEADAEVYGYESCRKDQDWSVDIKGCTATLAAMLMGGWTSAQEIRLPNVQVLNGKRDQEY
jgi:hypothetical protein